MSGPSRNAERVGPEMITPNPITDPGDAGAIGNQKSGYVPLVTGGAETRTLAAPIFIGQEIQLDFETDGGDLTLTVATTVNQTGNNTGVFADAGDQLILRAGQSGTTIVWRVLANDGITLSTV